MFFDKLKLNQGYILQKDVTERRSSMIEGMRIGERENRKGKIGRGGDSKQSSRA